MDTRERARLASAAASRARTLKRLRRLAQEMRDHGWTVIEPEEEAA